MLISVASFAQVELVRLTGQQFSSSHILEVYRGSFSQLVCAVCENKCFEKSHYLVT